MTDETVQAAQSQPSAPQGQALVNSHTFWGSTLAAVSGLGITNQLLPVVVTALTAAGVPDAPAVVQSAGVLIGFAWTLYGRFKAKAPISGILKAK